MYALANASVRHLLTGLHQLPAQPPQELSLRSPKLAPGMDGIRKQWSFEYHMLGATVGSLALQYFDEADWTTLWSRSGSHGSDWQRACVQLPADAVALRFRVSTGGRTGNIALDNVRTGPVDFMDLTCNFEFDSCNWFSGLPGSTWQHVVDANASGQHEVQNGSRSYLWASNTSEGKESPLFLESPHYMTPGEHALAFAYQVVGSHTAALELQYKTASNDWVQLFAKTGGQGSDWREAIVSIPAGSTALRFQANLTSEDAVSLDSFVVMNVASGLENINCSFEADLCGWAVSGHEAVHQPIRMQSIVIYTYRNTHMHTHAHTHTHTHSLSLFFMHGNLSPRRLCLT